VTPPGVADQKRNPDDGETTTGRYGPAGQGLLGRLPGRRSTGPQEPVDEPQDGPGATDRARARAERGDYGLLDNAVLIEDLKAEYLKHCRQTKKPGTVDRYEASFAAILPHMPRKVSAVTIQRVLAYREERLAAGTSPGTVNTEVTALGGMFNWGVKYQIVGSNPLKGLEPLPHDQPKEGRPLADSEVAALLDNSPQHYADIWYCLLVTGMRVSELANLRFADIDWEARELVVQRGVAKNHTARRTPLDAELSKILR